MRNVAQTKQGKVEGQDLRGQIVFKGIPYAAPPVGALRWHPPEPAEGWSGIRLAHEFGNPAMQIPMQGVLPSSSLGPVSEDCLFLNVWTPALDDARRPVMVWIHGGAFMYGTGHDMIPDRQSLVERGDLVLVSFNYRLGSLGFLNLRELTGGDIPASGNEGLLDQVRALEWVQENIANFGGDADNVTIFGESAGGMSVGALLGLPAARGLYRRAIPQSGASHTANPPDRTLRIAERTLELAGARDRDALLSLSSQACLELELQLLGGKPMQDESAWHPDPEIGSQPFQPCVDGEVLPDLPIRSVAKGSAAGVSIFVGSTLDENKAFVYAEPSLADLDHEGIHAMLSHLPRIDELISAYQRVLTDRGTGNSALDVLAQLGTDRQFRLPAIRLAEAQAAHSEQVYSYLVTWPSPAMSGAMGATHGIELGPLFGSWNASPESEDFFGSGPEMEKFSEDMQDIWAAFAKTGNPCCKAIAHCPSYTREERATLMLGTERKVENAPYDEERAIWDSHPDESIGEW